MTASKSLRLPPQMYIAFGDYGAEMGVGCIDPVEDMDAAADALSHVEGVSGRDGRVLEITLDVATNQPESVRDVTDDCVRIALKNLSDRGYEQEAKE